MIYNTIIVYSIYRYYDYLMNALMCICSKVKNTDEVNFYTLTVISMKAISCMVNLKARALIRKS